MPAKPALRPRNPRFSSGPCTKHPGWSVDRLKGALVGRYHRAAETKARLALAHERTAAQLEHPAEMCGMPQSSRVMVTPWAR